MTAFQMAWLHFRRQKLQTLLIVLSLSVALAFSGLLLRLFALSQLRYDSLPTEINAVLGPKSGGIEILLGSLNLESKFHGVVPENLFRSLRAGATIHFEDGSVGQSKYSNQTIIPITFIGSYAGHSVIATDESFFSELPPKPGEIWVGSQVANKHNLKQGDEVAIMIRGTLSKKEIQKNFRIGKILTEKNNSWDGALFVSNESTQDWLLQTESIHPVWKNKILNYVLFKMPAENFSSVESLVNNRTVSQLIWVETEKQKLADLSNSAKDLGLIFVLAIFALAAFSIFGMMSLRYQTLRVSVATLEAIGYSPGFIHSWIFFESFLVGSSASLIAVVSQWIGFSFVKSSLGSTWLIPLAQSNSWQWSVLIIIEGLVFCLLGAGLSSWQMLGLQIHSELKAG